MNNDPTKTIWICCTIMVVMLTICLTIYAIRIQEYFCEQGYDQVTVQGYAGYLWQKPNREER